MFTLLLTTAAALLLLGGQVHGDYISHAALIDSEDQIGVSWGTLVITVQEDNGKTTTGMVCDDYMTISTADFLCQAAGFGSVDYWNNIGNASPGKKMSQSSWREYFGSIFALDDLRCFTGAERLDDCDYRTAGIHNCGFGEGLVLKCSMEKRGMDLDGMDVQLQKGNGVISANGTVVLNGTQGTGLVCADGVDAETAELLCKEAGYDQVEDYSAAKNIKSRSKLDCDTMRDRNISVIIEDLNCTSSDLGDCSASFASGECDADDALWLSCTNDRGPEWELTNLTLAYNEAGNHNMRDVSHGGRYGTVVVTVENTITGEQRFGLAPYTASSTTLSSMCYNAGYLDRYPVYRRTGQISDTSNTKLSCGFLLENDLNFVLSSLWCPGYYEDLSDCKFALPDPADPDSIPSNDDAMWLNC